jgi:hypothetical protein
MPKNIIIFSDGTGQAGGLRPDENRSNIYKLYRATRCGPDTDIDPHDEQIYPCARHSSHHGCGHDLGLYSGTP